MRRIALGVVALVALVVVNQQAAVACALDEERPDVVDCTKGTWTEHDDGELHATLDLGEVPLQSR